MNRARFAIVAALAGAGIASASGNLVAQKAPEFHSVLAGKKVEPPFKGQADVEYTQPGTKKNGDNVVTTLKVKNMAAGPIARLKITETWFDKAGQIVGAGETTLEKPLAIGAVETITIQTPWSAKMNGNGYNFTHANGTVKPKRLPNSTTRRSRRRRQAAGEEIDRRRMSS
jgi:hypothetical protein